MVTFLRRLESFTAFVSVRGVVWVDSLLNLLGLQSDAFNWVVLDVDHFKNKHVRPVLVVSRLQVTAMMSPISESSLVVGEPSFDVLRLPNVGPSRAKEPNLVNAANRIEFLFHDSILVTPKKQSKLA